MHGSNESKQAIAGLIQILDKTLRSKGAQLHVEVDEVGYTIYAMRNNMRSCIGCLRQLRDEVDQVEVLNRGQIGLPVLFIHQCSNCNRALRE